ncbi:uncharacterized protein MEPE_02220 [Melanopsichium pennsylvanicum]|uniref:WD40 repeat-like protein n=1 Tax=Melanopsichium pennsylvanicum TaxID=63383 RepID=A0AAJ4XLZ0_9BASI|nr:uncharacterized protein MEPE_02220 [Melanopsichium pennsylvanicum]
MEELDLTLSGAARAPLLSSTTSLHRAKEPFHVQTIPPNALPNAPPSYVTHLLSLTTSYGTPTLLAIADDSTLTLIDKTSGVVAESFRPFKDARITGAKIVPFSANNNNNSNSNSSSSSSLAGSFVASVSNGSVACWDTRTGLTKPVWTLQGQSKAPYLCVEVNQSDTNTVVAGTEQYGHGDSDIDIWDIRNPAAGVKSKYNEVHSDDITVLQYHPDHVNHKGILLSGSTDGLVSAIDTRISEEDDAVISVGNTGNSVAKAGWLYQNDSSVSGDAMDTSVDISNNNNNSNNKGNNSNLVEEADLNQVETELRRKDLGKVWAIGDMQTLALFDADKFDPIIPTTDVRSSSSLRPPWSSDYVIDAFASNQFSHFPNSTCGGEGLTLFVGKPEGGFATLTTDANGAQWGLRAVFPEQGDGTFYGHSDIVRSVEWDSSTNTLYTGGEDGNLCFWNFDNSIQSYGSNPLHSIPASITTSSTSVTYYNNSTDQAYGSFNSTKGPNSIRGGSNGASGSAKGQRYTPYK